MEFLYSQVVDMLISNGDIDTLASLWKEISYVPSLFYLKERINKSTSLISDILSIQFPVLKGINWSKHVCTEDFKFSIYKKDFRFHSDLVEIKGPFVSLVNYYDCLFLGNLIANKEKEYIINFFVNNRRRISRGLKIFFKLLTRKNYIPLTPQEKGSVLYWLLLDNKELLKEKKSMDYSLLYLLKESCNVMFENPILEGLLEEATREGNYYPILSFPLITLNSMPKNISIFLIKNTDITVAYNRMFSTGGKIKSYKFINAYLSREDITDELKVNLVEDFLSPSINYDITEIEYDRVFHNHFILTVLVKNHYFHSQAFHNLIDKYGIDETYNPYGPEGEEHIRDVKRFLYLKGKKDQIGLLELARKNSIYFHIIKELVIEDEPLNILSENSSLDVSPFSRS